MRLPLLRGMAKTIAIIFHRLGPYHWIRLAAASSRCSVVAIELSAETDEYSWDRVKGAAPFKRITLFKEHNSRRSPVGELVRRLHAALNECCPSVVLIPGWSDKGAIAGLQWCVANCIPAVVMSDSTLWDEKRVIWKEWVKRALVNLCPAALVAGLPLKDYIVNLGMPIERVFMGYDVVDNEYFSRMAKQVRDKERELRVKHGLPQFYFLASARFIEKKNLLGLLSAFARYRQGFCEPENSKKNSREFPTGDQAVAWDLVLLGDGELRPQIEKAIAQHGLQHCVHLPGFKQYDELPVYYDLAKAFIHASTTEQWGLVVNEAMASGLPVLVSNRCGCAQDLVQECGNGFTFDPYNIEDLAGLLSRIAKSTPKELERMGSASNEIISQWGPARFAQGLQDAVNKAMQLGPKRAGLLGRTLLRLLLI
jgi:1,2-diacylglycerol 3-alpha-glucosyltransferase